MCKTRTWLVLPLSVAPKMLRREFITILIACSCASIAASGQEISDGHPTSYLPSAAAQSDTFEETVVPITVVTAGIGLEAKFGTGFCLDPKCRFIGTNYHVAKEARPRKIGGQKVVQRYLASGPDDEGATLNELSPGSVDFLPGPRLSMKFNMSRDLAIYELRHPLPRHHGVAFSLGDLREGQEVDIYAYPKQTIDPIRKLLRFHGAFKGETTNGLLAFDYSWNANGAIRPGASGGIVVDRKTQQIVGILNGFAKNGETIALAVPVPSLVEFVTKFEPYLAQTIFPATQGISAVSTDLYPKYVPATTKGLQRRAEEPDDVRLLRTKAQLLADSMLNFIAVETLAWGSGAKEPAAEAAYEIRIIDGEEQYRSYPDGKKELQEIPDPSSASTIVSGSEWSDLPRMVGTELRLKVHQAADAVVNEQQIKVFQYNANAEDAVCKLRSALDFGFFKLKRLYTAACHGEVWTDKDTNIVRISIHYDFLGNFGEYRAVVTYGWLRRKDEASLLIPLTLTSEFERKKRIDWCRSQFMNYQVFGARVRIVTDQPAPGFSMTSQ